MSHELFEPNGNIIPTEYETDQISDGFHTFAELYHYRALYNAAWFNDLYAQYQEHDTLFGPPVKSWKHSDGELCFGGGWFVVVLNMPNGRQISNHYEKEYWALFDILEVEKAPEWDGHTPEEAAKRLEWFLRGQINET